METIEVLRVRISEQLPNVTDEDLLDLVYKLLITEG